MYNWRELNKGKKKYKTVVVVQTKCELDTFPFCVCIAPLCVCILGAVWRCLQKQSSWLVGWLSVCVCMCWVNEAFQISSARLSFNKSANLLHIIICCTVRWSVSSCWSIFPLCFSLLLTHFTYKTIYFLYDFWPIHATSFHVNLKKKSKSLTLSLNWINCGNAFAKSASSHWFLLYQTRTKQQQQIGFRISA